MLIHAFLYAKLIIAQCTQKHKYAICCCFLFRRIKCCFCDHQQFFLLNVCDNQCNFYGFKHVSNGSILYWSCFQNQHFLCPEIFCKMLVYEISKEHIVCLPCKPSLFDENLIQFQEAFEPIHCTLLEFQVLTRNKLKPGWDLIDPKSTVAG